MTLSRLRCVLRSFVYRSILRGEPAMAIPRIIVNDASVPVRRMATNSLTDKARDRFGVDVTIATVTTDLVTSSLHVVSSKDTFSVIFFTSDGLDLSKRIAAPLCVATTRIDHTVRLYPYIYKQNTYRPIEPDFDNVLRGSLGCKAAALLGLHLFRAIGKEVDNLGILNIVDHSSLGPLDKPALPVADDHLIAFFRSKRLPMTKDSDDNECQQWVVCVDQPGEKCHLDHHICVVRA